MFGIKTKKDKRIEALEEKLLMLHMKTPVLLTSTKDLAAIGGRVMLEDGMPVEVAKRRIAQQMIEYCEGIIHYEVEDVEGKRFLKGYLYVKG